MKQKEKNSNISWIIKSFIITFILSGLISYISSNGVSKLNIWWALLILAIVVAVGIFFDIIGVAVTIANENHFHAKATKRVEGSKASLKLIKNSSKVANFCADIVGDICGVVSGALSTMIALKIIESYNLNENFQFIISALVASITVGGKAIGKDIAANNSTSIVQRVGKVLNKFSREK